MNDSANETGQSMQDILSEAVEEMRRRHMFEFANEAEWQEELAERRLWDTTLADGLEVK